MGTIDITSRLENCKPSITIAEGESYEINDDKNNVIKMNAWLSKSKLSEIDSKLYVISTLLGSDAVAEIEKRHPDTLTRLSSIHQIFLAVSAAVSAEAIEDVDARFRTAH